MDFGTNYNSSHPDFTSQNLKTRYKQVRDLPLKTFHHVFRCFAPSVTGPPSWVVPITVADCRLVIALMQKRCRGFLQGCGLALALAPLFLVSQVLWSVFLAASVGLPVRRAPLVAKVSIGVHQRPQPCPLNMLTQYRPSKSQESSAKHKGHENRVQPLRTFTYLLSNSVPVSMPH